MSEDPHSAKPDALSSKPFFRLVGLFIVTMIGLAILSHEIIPRIIKAEGMDVTAPTGLLLLLYIPAYLFRHRRWALHLLASLATLGAVLFTLRFGVWIRDAHGVSDWTTAVAFIPAIAGLAIWRFLATKSG
ncbi:hypothetical protein [Nitrobacter sp.]|uniref:hypothetical protein n=1 Tax=Nitrobacter sp. TaxID=29420 RepID=UPI003F64E9D9